MKDLYKLLLDINKNAKKFPAKGFSNCLRCLPVTIFLCLFCYMMQSLIIINDSVSTLAQHLSHNYLKVTLENQVPYELILHYIK